MYDTIKKLRGIDVTTVEGLNEVKVLVEKASKQLDELEQLKKNK